MHKYLMQVLLAVAMGLSGAVAVADTHSDLLIVLNSDGLSYTVQHTLTTDGELMVLTLPAARISLQVQFNGPEKITFDQAHRMNPEQLSLWSGSAITRYRLHRATPITVSANGVFQMKLPLRNQPLSVENIDSLSTSITWILPLEFELLTFSAGGQDKGRWSSSGNTVSYEYAGKPPPQITIQYQPRTWDSEQTDPCLAVIGDSDECSPDSDVDQVPDYRDICITPIDNVMDTTDSTSTTPDPTTPSVSVELVDKVFGCSNPSLMVLDGVRFTSGQSYLDVNARQVLDRTAIALQRAPDHLFEIASHTDNAGRIAHNQRLSENRADAVRHYLMLRGVGPNQLQARGYGETSPVYDNRLASGRQANRRVELRRIE